MTIVTPTPVPHRAQVTIQYCGDVTGSYPQQYFTAANAYLAHSMLAAVTPNQDGVTLYPSLINSDPVNPANSLPPISIPATPNWPPAPTLTPTPTPGSNPWQSNAAKGAAQADNATATQQYTAAVQKVQQQLASIRQQLQPQLDTLMRWAPSRNSPDTSVLGCLALASQRLSIGLGSKVLVIASDMQENAWSDVVPGLRLTGVAVKVVDFYCTSAPVCAQTKSAWGQFFAAAGAISCSFADPQQTDALPPLLGGAWSSTATAATSTQKGGTR